MRIDWKQAFLFLILGLIIGGVLGKSSFFFRHRFFSPSPEEHIQKKMNRFSRELDLSAEQKEKVEAIIKSKREKIDALRAEMKPKIEEIRSQSKDEIRALLNDDQKKNFEVIEERREKKRKKWGQWKE